MLRPISRGIFSRANNALQSALCSILVKLLSLEKKLISFSCLSLFRVWSSIGNYFMSQELFYKSDTAFKNQLKIFNSYIHTLHSKCNWRFQIHSWFCTNNFQVHRWKIVEIEHFDRSGSRKKVVATKQE